MRKFLLAQAIGIALALPLSAQQAADSVKNINIKKGKLTLEGYVDAYYSYAISHPVDANHAYFVSYNRDNEININLAYISLKYNSDRIRATFTPGYGTYMNANYASERQTLQNLLEANVGVKIFAKKDIWLDAGVISSPYTNETAYSFDQINYTRSLASENVPYYLTGAKLTVPFGKWTAYLYVLNGWQVIQAQHDPLDFGSQLEFKPNGNWDINWNTYIGDERSAANPGYETRWFTDGYATYTPSDKWSFSADAYIGWQRRMETGGLNTRQWWNANLCARYTFAPGSSFSGRVEYFHDPYQVLLTPVTNTYGFKLGSASLGYNLAVTDDVLFRLEGRYFGSPSQLYPMRDGTTANKDLWLTAGITARFR
ncbi:MAG TPA: outer membrane beta-barrel protein [Puia sp.]|uniref:outer membrane beta-barrel protein n=1 Tax=Puia sp. TaxID=2045100 RepID=UPI002B5C8515|nr:outer membrane beta-barrel protein [Puia sp.]HVU97065.1 outer membrane beta-barrel protein [Puia sp.]